MTPDEAAAIYAQVSANHGLIMWFITLTDPAQPGRAIAYAIKASNSGGYRLSGELVGDTIEAVRAMLPAGLRQHGRTHLDAAGTVEMWD